MRAIRQRTFPESIVGQFRRFVFDRSVVVEGAKSRLVEMRTELSSVDAVILETLQKHGLDPAKALPKLDQMSPYQPIVAELRDLITQRNVSTSLSAIIEDYEIFVTLATDSRCKEIASMPIGGDADHVGLSADEAKFLLSPFDAKAFAKGLEPEHYTPAAQGIGTALGRPSPAWQSAMPEAPPYEEPAPASLRDLG